MMIFQQIINNSPNIHEFYKFKFFLTFIPLSMKLTTKLFIAPNRDAIIQSRFAFDY